MSPGEPGTLPAAVSAPAAAFCPPGAAAGRTSPGALRDSTRRSPTCQAEPRPRRPRLVRRPCGNLVWLMAVARLALALLVVLSVNACGSTRAAVTGDSRTPSRFVLQNGVPVIVEEHQSADVAAVQLWVKTGGRDEAAAELGLAHYLEHMVFKGTATRPPGFVEREVEGVGGRMNAATSWDYTFYHVILPAGRVHDGIEMLADVAQNATLDGGLLDAEKQVVLEEMRLGEDRPRVFLARRLHQLLFPRHPYGRPVLGTPELIRALSRETLATFYRRYYVPEAFALVVVGAVDRDDVLQTARATFGRMPRSGLGRLPAPAPPVSVAHREETPRPGAQAHLGLAWPGPRLAHADTPAVDLLATVLGGRRSSRLVSALRDRDGLVTGIGAGFSALEAAGMVTVTAQLSPANVEAAEAAILAEVRRIRDEGVTTAELRRAMTVTEARREFSLETAEGRARALGRAETVWRIEDELAYLSRVRSVTGEQVRAVARRYLDPERYVRLALVPPR